jgi:hypothetical protein
MMVVAEALRFGDMGFMAGLTDGLSLNHIRSIPRTAPVDLLAHPAHRFWNDAAQLRGPLCDCDLGIPPRWKTVT